MRKFPAYTYEQVMKEKATRVFELVNQSIRLDAQEQLSQILVSMAPHMDNKQRKRLIAQLEFKAQDPSEWLDTSNTKDQSETLKNIFGSK